MLNRKSGKSVRRRSRLYSVERLEARIFLAADVVFDTDEHWSSDGQDQGVDLRHDAQGNAYFLDPLPADIATEQPSPFPMAASGDEDSSLEVPNYHSYPAAEKKIYLDFNGHVVTGTSWNSSNDGNPIHARAFDIDGDIYSFNQTELDRIFNVWERVSEDFSPFQVDVTTEDPGTEFFEAGRQGIRILISTNVDDERLGGTGNQWFEAAGGVGYVNSWNWTTDTPAWVFSNELGNTLKKVSEAASHEIGHTLGLSHDGVQGGDAYFEGHGNWAPIMGNGYHRDITQWSSGEYRNADNTQNDLAIITQKVPYRADDHGDSPSAFGDPTPLTLDGQNASAGGIIERSDDTDAFFFTVGPGTSTIDLSFDPWHNSPNLDIHVSLHNEAGTILLENNPRSKLDARIQTDLGEGNYYLAISGVGEADPSFGGYSDYASIGQYNIHGIIQTVTGDFTEDAVVDADDIDQLSLALLFGIQDSIYDLDQSGTVDAGDMDELIFNILETSYGDANLDGIVDGTDFNIWSGNKFQTQVGWAGGNFNGDLTVDGSDFNVWLENRFTPVAGAAWAAGDDVDPGFEPNNSPPRAALSSHETVVSFSVHDRRATVSAVIPSTPSSQQSSQFRPTSTAMGSSSLDDASRARNTSLESRRSIGVQQQRIRARRVSHQISSARRNDETVSQPCDVQEIAALDRFFSRLRTWQI